MDRKQAEEKISARRRPRPEAQGGSAARLGRGRRRRIAEPWEPILQRRRSCWSKARPSTASMFGIARTLVRLAEETPSPTPSGSASTASRTSIAQAGLFSEAPIYDDLETLKLADSLSMFMEMAGGRQPAGQAGAGRQVAAGSGPPS